MLLSISFVPPTLIKECQCAELTHQCRFDAGLLYYWPLIVDTFLALTFRQRRVHIFPGENFRDEGKGVDLFLSIQHGLYREARASNCQA